MKFFLALVFSLVGIFVVRGLVRENHQPQMPEFSQVPAFNLVDSSGNQFSSEQLKEKVWIAQFFFTSCAHICPTVTGKVAALKKRLPSTERLKIVSISVDPEKDLPAVLANYAARFGADGTSWKFLTGNVDVINNLLENIFYLGTANNKNAHSTRLAIVDQNMKVRGYYNTQDQSDMYKLVQDANQLLKYSSTQKE